MSFKDIFRRLSRANGGVEPPQPTTPDEVAFLWRLDRLALRTYPLLRGQAAGERPSARRLPSSDFREHRPYMPGDDLRHIDWNASARSEHVYVKLGERPRAVTAHILLDRTASMQWGQPPKAAAAQRLAAALGYIVLNHGDRLVVSGLPYADQPFGPVHGKGRVPGLLRFLRDLPAATTGDLVRQAGEYARAHPNGGCLLLISDLLAVPDVTALLEAFPRPTWQVTVLHVLHPAELNPGFGGELELRDVETGQRANYDVNARVIARYQAHVRAWCDRLEQLCYGKGALYARIQTDWPIEQVALPYLRRRGVVEAA